MYIWKKRMNMRMVGTAIPRRQDMHSDNAGLRSNYDENAKMRSQGRWYRMRERPRDDGEMRSRQKQNLFRPI